MNITILSTIQKAYERRESSQDIEDYYFSVDMKQPESLQTIADSYFSVEITNQRACNTLRISIST